MYDYAEFNSDLPAADDALQSTDKPMPEEEEAIPDEGVTTTSTTSTTSTPSASTTSTTTAATSSITTSTTTVGCPAQTRVQSGTAGGGSQNHFVTARGSSLCASLTRVGGANLQLIVTTSSGATLVGPVTTGTSPESLQVAAVPGEHLQGEGEGGLRLRHPHPVDFLLTQTRRARRLIVPQP